MKRLLLAAAATLATIDLAAAQTLSAPQPIEAAAPLPALQDIPYPGTLRLAVDATDLDRRIFRIKETIPAKPGPLTLLYPRWIPGAHGPVGPIHNYAGLKITANGQPVRWVRDPSDVYAFQVVVPDGASALEIEAQFLTPTESSQGGAQITKEMMRLNWYVATLYPAGYFARQIQIEATVRLPRDWQFGTALEPSDVSISAPVYSFKPVSLETLLDSPLFAGKHFKKIDLDPKGRSRVTLNVMADEPEFLEVKPPILAAHRKLIDQADKLYGARHFDHYDFLLSLSDRLAGSGIEHHRSSDNGTDPKYFTTWDTAFISRDLLPHEYNHSWNGKFRRPADLWTPNFNTPMRDSLLWVYEGQTQYYGTVLAARAGFVTKQQALDSLAATAATYDTRIGRTWRNLQDTTNDPIIAARRALPWSSYQRSEDYYSEGLLVWLEVDTLIRERSGGRRSLDTFARNFFGMRDGDWGVLTYDFDDVVAALNKVEPYDWATFLRQRLEDTNPRAPLDGLKRGGYRLVYKEEPTATAKSNETRLKSIGLSYSLGASFDSSGKITNVMWDGPVYRAGLISGMQVVAVNDIAFDGDKLRAAVKATKTGGPIEFLIKENDRYRRVKIEYNGGLRYPHLERIKNEPARLDQILAPR